uniref:SH3 domain-containing protein n=1 Tax=Anolis carolinensis TaxID=28377 RepID=A0A803THG2_ANOCA
NTEDKNQQAKQHWCRVLFPYAPTKEDVLELSTGDLVQILEEIEDGWWLGKKRGQLGVFPSNFVQELSGPSLDTPFLEPKGGAAKQRPKMTNETFVLDESEKMEKPATSPSEQALPNSEPGSGGSPGLSIHSACIHDSHQGLTQLGEDAFICWTTLDCSLDLRSSKKIT